VALSPLLSVLSGSLFNWTPIRRAPRKSRHRTSAAELDSLNSPNAARRAAETLGGFHVAAYDQPVALTHVRRMNREVRADVEPTEPMRVWKFPKK